MAKITDGSFRDWHDTDVIKASEYTQEREMLRVALNDNDTRLSSLEESAAGILLNTTQKTKITNDEGGVNLTTASKDDDILQIILNAGIGLRTFYAVGGSKNLPTANNISGMAHMTEPGIIKVSAMDYQNTTYTNSRDSTGWKGWKRLISNEDTQEELWSGALYMHAAHTVTPTKKLTQCKNGWILVWSDYSAGAAANTEFCYSYIPKFIAVKNIGTGHLVSIPQSPDLTVVKKLNIYDSRIVGNDSNNNASDNNIVLRFVVEW